MDVISMHQAGFDNAVASLGTALTPGQVNLIKRYTDRVYLAYDSDEAGTKAALRALGIMREFEMPSRVISLKPYKDPDELIQAEGTESFERRIEQAVSGTMFEIGILEHNYNQEDPQERTQFQKEAARILSVIEDPLERNNYIESVAGKYRIDKDSLKETVTQYGISGAARINNDVFRERKPRKSVEEEKQQKQLKAERLLITWLINDNSLFDKIKDVIGVNDFLDPVYRDVVEHLLKQYETDGKVTPAAIINHYQSKEEHEKVSGIMQQEFDMEIAPSEKSVVITDLVKNIKRRSLQHQLEEAKEDLQKMGKLMMEKAMIDRIQIHI